MVSDASALGETPSPLDSSKTAPRLWLHLLLLAIFTFGVVLLSLREPQFGDDFKYWTFGYNVHERGLSGWTDEGFHQLRWPIWGLLWLGQGIFGYGLASYYIQPFVMMMLGALSAFTVGWFVFRRVSLAWGCGVFYVLHPILDMNLTRPFPDVGEGVLGAGAVLAWWALMEAQSRGRIALFSLLSGLCLFLAEENRLTGVFFIPLLGCLTLLFYPRRLLRLLLPYAVFGVLLAGQMSFYQWKFGHWDHFLRANATAKGRQGTEAVSSLWKVPGRFLDALHKGDGWLTINAIFAILGCWFAWRRFGRPGRIVLAWFVLLYLAYACAPQQLWPFRPLLRNADRFLSALVVPYAVLTTMGIAGVLELASRWSRTKGLVASLRRRPVLTCAVGTLAAVGASLDPIGDRTFYHLGYIPGFSNYMRSLPADAVVFTHYEAKQFAFLVDPVAARRLRWMANNKWITEMRYAKPEVMEQAKAATEFWYIRKLAMLGFAKAIETEDEKRRIYKQPPYAPWFDAPEQDWKLARVLINSDNPDVVLYTRRPAGTAPVVFAADAPEVRGLFPVLPYAWKKGDLVRKDSPVDSKRRPIELVEFDWAIPPAFRGRNVRVEMESQSDDREALALRFSFSHGGKDELELAPKLNIFRDGGKEFACFPVPATADTVRVRARFSSDAKWLKISNFRVIVD